jgi:hypothetical protein
VCHFFLVFFFLKKQMVKKNKVPEAKSSDQSPASKQERQSAPLASAISTMEKAKKPKAVTTEATLLSPPCPAKVAQGTSAMNVAEDAWKIPTLPKYAVVPREVFFGAASVEPVVVEEAPSSVAGVEDIDNVEENVVDGGEGADKADDDDDEYTEKPVEVGTMDNDDEAGTNDQDSDYAPAQDGSDGDGTVDIADDVDNLTDKVKPVQKEKVSSPFDLPILPIARTFLVKQGKKGKKGMKITDGHEESLLLLSDEEAPPLRSQKKKELATKLPVAGSSSKVGTTKSSEDVLMMIKGTQEEFFNLPWKSYVSVFILFTFLFL